MIKRITRFFRCVRDVPPRQLARRLQLQFTRSLMCSGFGVPFRNLGDELLPLKDQLFHSLFKERDKLIGVTERGIVLRQLGEEYSLEPPVDWLCAEKHEVRHLDRLALHYHEFLESLPFKNGHAILVDWIQNNPPWRKGYWLDSWNSYAISIRCVCWFQWLARHRSSLSSDDLGYILRSLSQQLKFLAKNLETDICGNHLIKNIRCLLWASACSEGASAKAWGELGWSLLVEQFPVQFPGDGLHFELSPAYHCQVFADLLDCLMVVQGERRSWLESQLAPVAQCMCDLTHPDGLISLFSDSGLHMVYSPNECVRVFSELCGKRVTQQQKFALKPSGYAGIRLGEDYLLFDAGPTCDPRLPAHGHGDMLSFEWDIAGNRFVVDPGVFEYEPGCRRQASRSAMTHNTVIVGNWDQCEFIGSFRTGWKNHAKCEAWRALNPSEYEIKASYYHSQAKYSHVRSLKIREGELNVVDLIEGCSYPESYAGILLSHEAEILDEKANEVLISFHGMTIKLTSESKIILQAAEWCSDFGVAHPTVRIRIEYGPVPGEFGFQFQRVK